MREEADAWGPAVGVRKGWGPAVSEREKERGRLWPRSWAAENGPGRGEKPAAVGGGLGWLGVFLFFFSFFTLFSIFPRPFTKGVLKQNR